MKIKSSLFSLIAIATTLTFAQNCTPSGCSASCSPACSVNDVCTLGTMITCGVCPGSKCISRVALGLPPISSSTDTTNSGSTNNSGLIGGIVGGLLGGGLILGGLTFLILRHGKSKKNLPLAFRSKHLDRTIPAIMDEEMQERAISGVIPVTFIPPLEQDEQQDNPFNDRPISNAHSIMTTTTTYNNNSRRGSMESNISHQQVATIVQATQVTRAKPQIMRVNTVKVNGMTRTGSLKKTIQPAPAVPVSTNKIEEENPFDDKNKVEIQQQQQQERKITNSVISAPGDGEITIFWNGT